MYSTHDTPLGWVAPFGHPRINACSRLPVAFRSVPRPSSPPGAKASTECPSLARYPRPFISEQPISPAMHRNHPRPKRRHEQHLSHGKTFSVSAHTDVPLRAHPTSTPLNAAAGQPLSTCPIPTKGMSQAARPDQTQPTRNGPPLSPPGPTQSRQTRKPPRCPAHPETHQNLIHMNKEPAPLAPATSRRAPLLRRTSTSA